jgi:type IV pilus assembly protein PilV
MQLSSKEIPKSEKWSQAGFSLVEILVGISILAIGMLAVAQMQITAIQGLDQSIGGTSGMNVARQQLEQVINLPYTDANLTDSDTANNPANGGDLTSTVNTDTSFTVDLTATGGQLYTVIYNVADNANVNWPAEYKQVVVMVRWQTKGKWHTRTLACVKSRAS